MWCFIPFWNIFGEDAAEFMVAKQRGNLSNLSCETYAMELTFEIKLNYTVEY